MIILDGQGGGTQCIYIILDVAMPCDFQAIGNQKTLFLLIRVRVSMMSGHKFPLWVSRLAIMNYISQDEYTDKFVPYVIRTT